MSTKNELDLQGLDHYILAGSDTVAGWFGRADSLMFAALTRAQLASGVEGDLLEIGAYLGRSAILLGYVRGPGELLHICDIFEGKPETGIHSEEQSRYYESLTRREFETNFLRFHADLPTIHHVASHQLPGRVPGMLRFVHVDGSHLFEPVREDLRFALRLLSPGGVIAVDDYRQEHTPGVAAALWELVTAGALEVFAATRGKAYVGRRGDVESRAIVDRALGLEPRLMVTERVLFGDMHPPIPQIRNLRTQEQRSARSLRQTARSIAERTRSVFSGQE